MSESLLLATEQLIEAAKAGGEQLYLVAVDSGERLAGAC
jgi:hypothetical protein